MRESNHSSITQTLGYSYASEHDEYETVEDVSKHMLERQFSVQEPAAEPATPREMAPKKFLALRDDPNVRLLLDDSVCVNRACVPSIDICSDCEFFQVNPRYQEPLERYIEILSARAAALRKSGGNPKVIEFVDHQVDIYIKMLHKIVESKRDDEQKVG